MSAQYFQGEIGVSRTLNHFIPSVVYNDTYSGVHSNANVCVDSQSSIFEGDLVTHHRVSQQTKERHLNQN